MGPALFTGFPFPFPFLLLPLGLPATSGTQIHCSPPLPFPAGGRSQIEGLIETTLGGLDKAFKQQLDAF